MATLDDWKKFTANEPEAQREYRTIEVYHPALDKVYRFVDNYSNVTLTLESNAPRNPGEAVEFTASTLNIVEPSERNDSEQTLSVSMGSADGTLHDIIDQISGTAFLIPTDIVYRKYYSGNTTQPAIPPLYLYASSISFDSEVSATIAAEDTDLNNKRVGLIYTTELFKGLK